MAFGCGSGVAFGSGGVLLRRMPGVWLRRARGVQLRRRRRRRSAAEAAALGGNSDDVDLSASSSYGVGAARCPGTIQGESHGVRASEVLPMVS